MLHTDQLVSLETAKLAKEKGYNQNPYVTPNAYGPEFTDGSNIKLRSSSLFNPDSNTCVAPTQTSLQRWLRETCKKDVIVSIYSSRRLIGVWYKVTYDGIGCRYTLKTKYNVYESALEDGLQGALKILP